MKKNQNQSKAVYQIVEIALTEDPPSVNPLGTAYPTRTEAVQELETFLWEEVGQQQDDRPANWWSEISLMKTRDDHGEMIYCDLDAQFQWGILKVEIAQ